MSRKILMSGYYGFKNAGDDAVCYAIIDALKQTVSGCDITVLSNDPALTEASYHVKAVDRWKLRSVLPAILKTDVLVSGGGSLIQDVTSRFSSLYYLGIIFAAELFRKKVVIYSQGVGPLNDATNQRLTRMAFNHAHAVYVRDEGSAALLKQIGVKKPIQVVPDPVLGAAQKASANAASHQLLAKLGRKGERPLALLAPRSWQATDVATLFAAQGDALVDAGYEVGVLAMHHGADSDLCKDICDKMQQPAFLVDEELDIPMLFSVFAEADLVSAMRLHALVIGQALGKNCIAVSYDPKVTAFMKQVGAGQCLTLEETSVDALIDATQKAAQESVGADVTALCASCLAPAQTVAKLLSR